jgi:peroxiredoxin
VLSDPDLTAIDAYGLRHEGGMPGNDIARPATIIIDGDGNVVWRDITENWRVRPRPDELLEVLARTR